MGASITRRDLLVGAGLLAGCFALGGGVKAFAAEANYLRPPGGQDDAGFRALCVKCDRCRTVCPQNIIVPVSVDEGMLDARTPRLDYHLGYCDFCGRCQEVCPTQALSPDFDETHDALGVAVLNTSLCAAYSHTCELCRDSCKYGALIFDELNRPSVIAELCNGCGECENTCHVNVVGTYAGYVRALEVHVTQESSSDEG